MKLMHFCTSPVGWEQTVILSPCHASPRSDQYASAVTLQWWLRPLILSYLCPLLKGGPVLCWTPSVSGQKCMPWRWLQETEEKNERNHLQKLYTLLPPLELLRDTKKFWAQNFRVFMSHFGCESSLEWSPDLFSHLQNSELPHGPELWWSTLSLAACQEVKLSRRQQCFLLAKS